MKKFNMWKYIFEIKNDHLFVIDNPATDLSSIDFFAIKKIDGIYNYKAKSDAKNFAIAIIPNGSFYYRTIDKTLENIQKYKELIEIIVQIKEAK